MNKDDIIKLAQEAGLVRAGNKWVEPARWGVTELVHLAALVAAVEREACAKLCEEEALLWGRRYAAAIRARGNT